MRFSKATIAGWPPQLWQVLVASLAGWISRRQDAVIEFLREENQVLKQQLGGKRLRLTDAQRRRLAVLGKAIGRRALTEVASLVFHAARPSRLSRTKQRAREHSSDRCAESGQPESLTENRGAVRRESPDFDMSARCAECPSLRPNMAC